MTPKELADRLTGREYRSEITKTEAAEAKAAGLVVVFGASDDLMEFRGAIDDETGADNGATATVDIEGLMPDFDEIMDEAGTFGVKDTLRDYFRREGRGQEIEALWCKEGEYSWTYKTDIPHSCFEITEDGEPYCRGIVFKLSDAAR